MVLCFGDNTGWLYAYYFDGSQFSDSIRENKEGENKEEYVGELMWKRSCLVLLFHLLSVILQPLYQKASCISQQQMMLYMHYKQKMLLCYGDFSTIKILL